MSKRDEMRQLAKDSIDRGDATGWFEKLYQRAEGSWRQVPWADLVPNPFLVEWLASPDAAGVGKRCLVVGCGLGDDAEVLAVAGFDVVAFDVSATAIGGCRARFPRSEVEYVVADLLAPPQDWTARFDLVFESYTLQVLPNPVRAEAVVALAGLVAPAGRLLVLCRGREVSEPEGEIPWPLTREELDRVRGQGFVERRFEDFFDAETPPVRRFRALYEKA